ncbi:undecaprenyl-diphosphatase uppp [Lucifera butyrica]|uniref:Undecaprenyl-diphosphatase n=1 Tax=Lucifera butyrica TaxID=1351585 RepID=A0A498R682_9FIRM|nr:undecaprenyl-diphosphate phosphatase [Lucifera butyrica]VBB06921.1 undecaprenyl-diphosphatase uppp [Lucifera butyrica]
MTLFQSLVFAVIQGITELFPISSVAHGVLTPYFFHWNLAPSFLKEHFLPFVVMLHLGTATALLLFFGTEWIRIIRSLFTKDRQARKLLWLIAAGTFPAALLGFILEKTIRHAFSNVTSAAVFLIINGFLLYWGEKLKGHGRKEINDLTYGQAAIVGVFQALALIPGFSRSGATITAGFWMGLRHEASARLSMLLATPIIIGAGIIEIPKLLHISTTGLLQISLIGGVVAGIMAYLSVWALMKWFHTNEINAMRPFSWYCWLVGIGVLASQLL